MILKKCDNHHCDYQYIWTDTIPVSHTIELSVIINRQNAAFIFSIKSISISSKLFL